MKLSHECAESPRPSCMQAVAGAAHGFNQAVVLRDFERLAQTPDMHVNRAFFDKHMVAPHLVEQLHA